MGHQWPKGDREEEAKRERWTSFHKRIDNAKIYDRRREEGMRGRWGYTNKIGEVDYGIKKKDEGGE